ncbi:putative RNA-directed DNA polymerase, eukaryota, reverse transcriptase zinc-binding domain protein [Tanacetum coccineum]
MQNKLSVTQSESLEFQLSLEEIKRVVWDCGGDRAPRSDGYSFKFFTTFWDMLKDDVVHFVHEFFLTCSIMKGCQYKIIGKLLANRLGLVIGSCISLEQSAFIKGRNILDGPLILNEVMAWYRKHKKELMVFKVDFKKAFNSLRWDYLDLNARSSVLVNGSPTPEFDICRGLRQGDPLSPFLFILAMEGLYMLTCKAKDMGIFTRASLGHDNMCVSLLIYADDVIFLGEWSWLNAHNLLCLFRCFYLISGLKINVNKSNIFGVGVPDEYVFNMANTLGCGAASFPMKYLGVPVGCNMAICSN